MINYTTAQTEKDLLGILNLQKLNLAKNLSANEIQSQGFVTVEHSYEDLKKLNDIEQHVIAKDDDKVIGYLLAMTSMSKFDIPVLIPMFKMFDEIIYEHKLVSTYNYVVVGQVCINKNYRGQGILDNCYFFYRNHFKEKYAFAITEIDSINHRSRNAHKRMGFREVYNFGWENKEWIVVLWNWTN